MEKQLLSRLAGFCGAAYSGKDIEITNISTDSRRLDSGSLFVPLKGERFDGHDFLENAAKLCAAVVSERDADLSVPLIKVEDTLAALGAMAAGYKAGLHAETTAITGSVGKTTTKEMLGAILSRVFNTVVTEGNFNNEVGLPLTVFRMDASTEAAVLEMGMNHFGEISRLTRIARPDHAVITTIGSQHIEFLGSREGILRAKLEILEGMSDESELISNGDCELLRARRSGHYFGIENPECEYRAENISGTSFTLKHPDGSVDITLPIAGRHNIYNALAASAAALRMGAPASLIPAALAEFKNTGMRQKIYEQNGVRIIEDCYNAGPESMRAALDVLAEYEGTKYAVLGDMLELGEHSVRLHREAVEYALARCDRVFLFGERMKTAGGEHFADRSELVRALKTACHGGETILFKASRAMKTELILKDFLGDN